MTKFSKVLIAFVLAAVVFSATAEARYRGHGGGHYRGGWGYYGGGFATGLLLGGMIAAPRYYNPAPRYYYPAPSYYYGPPRRDAVAYCLRRFKSYDPRSGTYLGYDGYRHPCP